MISNIYMQRAIELAEQAAQIDEVPVGAVIVDPTDGKIIAEAGNQTIHLSDSTAHAEILAIRKACNKLKSDRLRGLDMYVTLEPCTMCAAAISFARINRLYIGALDKKGGAVVNGVRFYEAPTCHHRPEVHLSLLNEDCSTILKQFFQAKRN